MQKAIKLNAVIKHFKAVIFKANGLNEVSINLGTFKRRMP